MRAKVFHAPQDGPPLASGADVLELIHEQAADADWIAVPIARLDPAFFDLRSGLAGDVVQRFVNYRIGLAIVGDIDEHLGGSTALRDFVREANRGRQIWFVADETELAERLGGSDSGP